MSSNPGNGKAVRVGAYGPFQPLASIFETAEWAERHGMDSYWLGDRAMAFPDPDVIEAWSALAAVAMRTSHIKLGMAVTDTQRRHPSVLAQTITALDHISNGRALPGVGVGERANLNPFGVPLQKGPGRLEEFVRLMKLYWTGEPIDFQGEYFTSEGGTLRPTPIQVPHPPVFLAGNTPRTLEAVGRAGDGWLPAALTPDMYAEDLAKVRAAAEAAGRDPDAIEPGLFMYTVLNEDAELARETARQIGGGIMIWWRGSLKRLGFPLGADDLTVSNFDGREQSTKRWLELGQEVPSEAVDLLINAGSAEDVARRMREFIDAGCRHFVVLSLDGLGDLGRWKETVAAVSDSVVPALGLRV
jgi:phthiodiolone/phenolphthiodiolone dimycocerosates ketoreductase